MDKVYSFQLYRKNGHPPADTLKKAARIFCDIWQEEPWKEEWNLETASDALTRQFSKPDGMLILASDQNKVVGFTSGHKIGKSELSEKADGAFIALLSEKPIFNVTQIGVDKAQSGHGLGQKLLNRLITEALNIDPNYQIILHTDQKAESAKKLYTKVGLTDTGLQDLRHPNHTYWIYKNNSY